MSLKEINRKEAAENINSAKTSGQQKAILLIAYIFPPYYGIGGRRWAKHAIGLTKLGYVIHVITAKNHFKEESLWYEEVRSNSQIVIHTLPSRYPAVLLMYDHSFFDRIRYKFYTLLLPLLVKGTIYERTVFWKKLMLNKAKELIKRHNITKVICTGGPFGPMYYATYLKDEFPDLKLLNDFRDPWTWGPNWGFATLSKDRMAYEKKMEETTVGKSDIITVPNEAMLNYMHMQYPDHKRKIIEVPHFFDASELIKPAKTRSERVRLVYYGTIYESIGDYLEQAAEFFASEKDRFILDIYTDTKEHMKVFEKYNATNVRTFPQKPLRELVQMFSDYDFVFIMTPDYGRDNISTKFFEILYTQTPIILFVSEGMASRFIVENSLGIHVTQQNFRERMLQLQQRINFKFNTQFDLSRYELTAVSKQIGELMEESQY